MQTLPATFAEAEAVQFARHWLANVSEAAFLDSGHPSLDPAAAHWFVRRIIKQYVESHPLNAVEITLNREFRKQIEARVLELSPK